MQRIGVQYIEFKIQRKCSGNGDCARVELCESFLLLRVRSTQSTKLCVFLWAFCRGSTKKYCMSDNR